MNKAKRIKTCFAAVHNEDIKKEINIPRLKGMRMLA
jgi:hypothetical protein